MPFSEQYFRLFDDTPAFGERIERNYLLASSGGRISERLLQCIWYDRLFDESRLTTRDGRRVLIHSPGTWNLEAGPDFKNAEISVGGLRLRGDIEVHIDTSGWRAHGHNLDPQYDGVALHVALTGRAENSPPLSRHGIEIAEVVLWEFLGDSLKVLRCALRPEEYPYGSMRNYGRCQGLLEHLPPDVGERLLLLSGDARIIVKQRRFAYESERCDLDQVAYAATLEAMGYKAYTKQFGMLARKLPYARLRERVLSAVQRDGGDAAALAQALLLHAAGLIPAADADVTAPEARAHYRRLRLLVRKYGVDGPDAGAIEWKAAAVRPANRPERRIAGISHLLACSYKEGIYRAMLGRMLERDRRRAQARSLEFLTGAHDEFWSFYFSAKGKRLDRPAAIVGRDRAQTVLVNTFVPLALLHARSEQSVEKEERVHQVFRALPAPQPNSVTRLMEYRMFGAEAKPPAKSARAQQGFLQIFADWCSEDPACENCGILAGLQSGYICDKVMQND